MTDDPTTQFANLLASELEAAEQRWAEEIMKIEAETAAKHALHSGGRILVTELLCGGLEQYRQCISDKWRSYVRPRFAVLSATDLEAFFDVALAALDNAVTGAVAQSEARHKPKLQEGIDFSRPIKATGQIARRTLESELRPYMRDPVDKR